MRMGSVDEDRHQQRGNRGLLHFHVLWRSQELVPVLKLRPAKSIDGLCTIQWFYTARSQGMCTHAIMGGATSAAGIRIVRMLIN